eukprot:scaffold85168_cov19-Tisochrysis_lutea.AAC.2
MVGCLVNGKDGETRLLSSQDYAYLLKRFGEEFWGLFKPGFIDGLPQGSLPQVTLLPCPEFVTRAARNISLRSAHHAR